MAEKQVMCIGNSLTADCEPSYLESSDHHVYSGQNLDTIYNNPDDITGGTNWDVALAANTYDYLLLQPYNGTTQSEDIAVIESWMALQPDAIIVIHTGWPTLTNFLSDYHITYTPDNLMTISPSYMTQLVAELEDRNPTRTFISTNVIEHLYSIWYHSPVGPFDEIDDLYRDDPHLTLQAGRYLAHNLTRKAIGQSYPANPSDHFTLTADEKTYLDRLITTGSIIVPTAYDTLRAAALAHYKMDETSGTTLVDAKGAYDGIYQNTTPSTDSVAGLAPDGGTAITFTGASFDNAVVSLATLSLPDADQTISAWIKTSSVNAYVVAERNTSAGGLSLFINGSGQLLAVIGTTGQANTTETVNNNLPHHVGITYNKTAGEIKYYIDGVRVLTDSTLSGTWTAAATCIGMRATTLPSGVNFLTGVIDDVMIYDSTLTDADMLTLAQGRQSTFDELLADAAARWPGLEGDELSDAVGSNDLTIVLGSAEYNDPPFPGWPGKSFYSAGFEDNVYQLTSAKTFSSGSPYSIEFWMRNDDKTTEAEVLGSLSPVYRFRIFDNGPSDVRFVYSDGATTVTHSSYPDLSEWVHCCVTSDGTNPEKIYLNGVATNNNAYTGDFVVATFLKGRFQYFDGAIYHPKFFSVELSSAQIATLMAGPSTGGGFKQFSSKTSSSSSQSISLPVTQRPFHRLPGRH